MPIELAFQFGVDQGDGGGAARRRRGQTLHGAAGATQVFVRRIDDQIRIRRVVNRGDVPVPNADRLMHHLHHRSQTIRGARGCGHDAVAVGVVKLMVHAHDHIQHPTRFDRSRHDDALGPTVEMPLQRLRREPLARAFQHHIHAQIAPRNLRRLGVR